MIPQDVTEVRPDYTEMKSRNSNPSHPVTESCRIIQVNKPQLVNYLLRNHVWVKICWKDLEVGDLVKVLSNEGIPADLVLLASSEPQAMCYIETSNLDGETNLKLRQGLPVTTHLLTAGELSSFDAVVECEPPNRKLDEFVGVIRTADGIAHPLNPTQLILRGASLKNTKWIFGLTVYTGKESKVMLNSTAAPLKRSTVERQTNTYILCLFGVLLFLTFFTFIANLVWTSWNEKKMWYLQENDETTLRYAINMLITSFIMYHTMVPISLQVCLEVVRLVQALLLSCDLDMYDSDSDTPAMARTSNLNEELGQVRYIFSDKTGTLTRNVMEFKRCSIGGIMYGNGTEDSNALEDQNLINKLNAGDLLVDQFFTILAVCHTVVPERSVNENNTNNNNDNINNNVAVFCNDNLNNEQLINYQASSPDEAALVKAARTMGYVFTTRTPTEVVVKIRGVEKHYGILHVLDFTSFRKRMGVVVREPNGRISVMVKGADTVIFERLASTSLFAQSTMDHLENFAKTGLRTLCIAWTEVDPAFYNKWVANFYKASTALNDREAKLELVANEIEQNLQLLGATAIEDKLQTGVPHTISNLMRAGISIWVLTGDKQETAINIGYSCQLLTQSISLLTMNTKSLDQTREQLVNLIEDFGDRIRMENDFALIVDGQTLEFALLCECREQFLDVALSCKSVICCRVSPWQKAQLVKLVRQSIKDAVTLAIGDGANDVGMIQAAHVGVGISGMEGRQAACASDYAIAQFRFLNKLLLVHGAWNYNRLTKLILYSFYKNVCLYLIQFWFAILSGFSGQIVFERWSIGLYNVIFTAAPPMALGLFDRSCSVNNCLKYPELYKDTQASASFNPKVFFCWIFNSIYHSSLLFWIPLLAFSVGTVYANGQTSSLLVLGNSVYTYVVVTVCLKAGLEHTAWTWLSHLAIWGSIGCWFLFLTIYPHVYPTLPLASDMVGMDSAVYGCGIFWFGFLLIPMIALTRDIAWKMAKRVTAGSLREQVMQMEQMQVDPGRLIRASIRPKSTDRSAFVRIMRRSMGSQALLNLCLGASVRTNTASPTPITDSRQTDHGYAFSQEEHGAVSQSQLIRAYDSTRRKPDGR
ncbi:phospholipid-transporting atpase [Schistosoma mansoni]|uniref:phospholipid-transporting atpase n=1 Tax=Schistosoma mansoni TaxID=6183 RepID=UPI0001A62A26|nr:phospholipid-transporting atpase [Schistosoma mansoni]|eukprot:XP_018644491.1 phospholipid-transporting atpase [Schistosoma mansoni]